jgi:hypothetical protein
MSLPHARLFLGAVFGVALLSGSAAAGIDPNAMTVTLEPSDATNVYVFVRGLGAESIALHPEDATFTVRRIGQTADLAVPATTNDEHPTCSSANAGCDVNYKLSWPYLEPGGAYELTLHPHDGLVTGPGDMALPFSQPGVGERSLNFYRPAEAPPPVTIGTKFIAIGQTYYDKPPLGSIWTLTRSVLNQGGDQMRHSFRRDTLEPSGPPTMDVDADLNYGDGYGPFAQLIDDPVVRQMNKRYVGKPLWTYGKYVFACTDSVGNGARVEADGRSPLFLSSIARVAGQFTRLPLGSLDPGWWCAGACHKPYHVFSDEPLWVILEAKHTPTKVVPLQSVGILSPWKGPCVLGHAYLLDDWDFERHFTLEDPRVAHREWSADLRRQLVDFSAAGGMTHEMVAFAQGYPSTFGTREELNKLSVWEWYPGDYAAWSASFTGDLLDGEGGVTYGP